MFSNEAFAQNAEKYMDTVFRVAYGWLKNPDDANDVTQDVLIELYKTDKAFESDAHLKNWLIRVTVNRCKMLFRSPWVYNGGGRVDARHSRKDRQHKTFSRKGEAQNDFGGGVKQ